MMCSTSQYSGGGRRTAAGNAGGGRGGVKMSRPHSSVCLFVVVVSCTYSCCTVFDCRYDSGLTHVACRVRGDTQEGGGQGRAWATANNGTAQHHNSRAEEHNERAAQLLGVCLPLVRLCVWDLCVYRCLGSNSGNSGS